MEIGSEFIELEYFVQIKDEKTAVKFRIPNSNEITKEIKLKSDYPYNIGSFEDSDGNSMQFKVAVLVDETHRYMTHNHSLLDYEILYIGQAFGKDGKRTAIDRLPSHSTLQKIYSESLERNPDSDIWLLLASFNEQSIGTMRSNIVMPKDLEEGNDRKWMDFMNPKIANFSDKQKLNFTEAALINTFKPQYNKEFKDTFPKEEHSSYDECYALEVNGVIIEVDTSHIRRWLYTEAKPIKPVGEMGMPYWQHGEFHFVDGEERYQMFNNDYM